MKHWQFYVALLLLAFLLLPIYEGLETSDEIQEGVYRIKDSKNKYCSFLYGMPICISDNPNETPYEDKDSNDNMNGILNNLNKRDEIYIKKLPNGLYAFYAWNNNHYATLCSNITNNEFVCKTDVKNEITEKDMYMIKNVGGGFYNIINKKTNKYLNRPVPWYGGEINVNLATPDETAKFQLIPVKLLSNVQPANPEVVYGNIIAPIQSEYDELNVEYDKINNSLLNVKLALPDVAARAGHVQNTLNQINDKNPVLEKQASELEGRSNDSDGSLLGLQSSYYEIRDAKEPELRDRGNQLEKYVATIQDKNIPDLNKMSDLSKKRMTNIDTVHIPIIDNKATILESDIADIKNKTKIESYLLNNLTVKGHFPDIATYNARPI
jgi:hypothetical protein